MKRAIRLLSIFGMVFAIFLVTSQNVHAQASGHASVGLGHGEEGFLHLQEMIKHLEFSLKMKDATSEMKTHNSEALKHAKNAVKHYQQALTHASESLNRPQRGSMMNEGSGMHQHQEEGSSHEHDRGYQKPPMGMPEGSH